MSVARQIVLAAVDDNLCARVKEHLTPAEWTVVVVRDADEARAAAQPDSAHLFLVDTNLGAGPVRDICSAIRSSSRAQIAIIAIIDSYTEILDNLMEATVDDILISPFTVFSLLARLNAQMKRITTAEQLDFKVRDSWTLINITSRLVGKGDLLYSLYDMVTILASELGANRGSVVLVRQQGDLGLVIASSDNREIQDLIINLDAYPEIRTVVSSRQPLIVTDVSDSPVLKDVLPTLQSMKVRSIALFPIVEENHVLGVIFLRYCEQRGDFHQRELVFCQTVANATAIALRNHEITESLRRKDQQIAQVQSEARNRLAALKPYENFFMSSMDGLMVLSDSGVVVFVNPEGAALFGLPPERIKGVPFASLLPESQGDRFESLIERSERGIRGAVDLDIVQVDGDETHDKVISVSCTLLGDEGMTLLTIRDVTGERLTARRLLEAQEQLIRSEKQTAIMELAGAAAHELNQPLTSVLTSLAIFKRLANDGVETPLRLLEAMEQEVDRMTAIIRKLSSLTDYTTRQYVGDARIVDLEGSARKSRTEADRK